MKTGEDPGLIETASNRTEAPVPFALGVVPFRQGGALRVTVVVKAAFSARPPASAEPAGHSGMGNQTSQIPRMTPAGAPEPYRVADVHHRNQPMARVVVPSDRAPRKRAVDVTVLGHAFASRGVPVPEMTARIALLQGGSAAIDKAVRVVGARSAKGGEPLPFVRMPITYERAYGGIGTHSNPIGCGEEEADDDDLPNILDPKDPSKPAGFGPISAVWPIRKKRLGATPQRDVESALLSLPTAFDLSYFQCAPEDQQIPELDPDAVLVLEGLHPEKERVEIGLPGARAFGAVYGLDPADPDAPTPIDFRADGLHVDADTWIATLTFRGSVEIRDESRLDKIVVATGVGIAGREPHIPATRPSDDQIRPAVEVSPAAKDRGELPIGGTLMLASESDPALATLPLTHEPLAATKSTGRSSDTLVLPLSSWSSGPTRDLSTATLALPQKPSLAGPLPPPAPLISPPPLMPTAPAPAQAAEPLVEPPPLLNAVPLPEPEGPPKRPEEIVNLERYGAISSALAQPGAKIEDVLRAEEVSPSVWRKADRHWRRELDREVKEGGRESRDRFDDAYIGAWEAANPGRFGLPEYARFVAAERRARLSGELSSQGLEASIGMRLRRVWRRRVASSAALGEELKKLTHSDAEAPQKNAE